MLRTQTWLLLAALPLALACSQAEGGKEKKKKRGESLENRLIGDAVPGLRRVGTLDGILESSGLCAAPQPGTYYTFGDDGQAPILYRIDSTGRQLDQVVLDAKNRDTESLTRDPQGNYYLGDCGNNNNDRQNLAVLRFRPEQPAQVARIKFSYPDQAAFPPPKKQRNFDCEASLWHGGKVYLFTKDRGAQATCKVYAVPDQSGTYTAQLVTKIALPGEVTDAALAPSGRRLVLLAREELFVFEGESWDALLKAAPRRVPLPGAGQTEGAYFKTENVLLITTEQGALYELTL